MREEWLKVIRKGSMPGERCACMGVVGDDDGREVRMSIREWGLIWTLAGYRWTARWGVNERERKMNMMIDNKCEWNRTQKKVNGCNIKYKRVKELRNQKKKRNEWSHHRKRQKAKNKEKRRE